MDAMVLCGIAVAGLTGVAGLALSAWSRRHEEATQRVLRDLHRNHDVALATAERDSSTTRRKDARSFEALTVAYTAVLGESLSVALGLRVRIAAIRDLEDQLVRYWDRIDREGFERGEPSFKVFNREEEALVVRARHYCPHFRYQPLSEPSHQPYEDAGWYTALTLFGSDAVKEQVFWFFSYVGRSMDLCDRTEERLIAHFGDPTLRYGEGLAALLGRWEPGPYFDAGKALERLHEMSIAMTVEVRSLGQPPDPRGAPP